MAEYSDRFALPFLSAGQAQKELYHNEAIAALDLLSHAVVISAGLNTPPSTPTVGQCWIIGASPVGAWSGHAHALAGWSGGGWRFVAPRAGMIVWDEGNGYSLLYDGSAWINGVLTASSLKIGGVQVVGNQTVAIADPTGGAVIDTEARTALGLVLDALRTHGLIST